MKELVENSLQKAREVEIEKKKLLQQMKASKDACKRREEEFEKKACEHKEVRKKKNIFS